MRDTETFIPSERYRNLKAKEIEQLISQGNYSEHWEKVYVLDPIDLTLIRTSTFEEEVYIGSLEKKKRIHNGFSLSEGIVHSTIRRSIIGSHCALKDVLYLSDYHIADHVMLHAVDEMKYLKESNGELTWVRIINEAGGREVALFDEMSSGDAALWATYRERKVLLQRLSQFTEELHAQRANQEYATVGAYSVIKSSRMITNVVFGSHAYVKGANKLKNLVVKSNQSAPTLIGEGVELINGVLGFGSRVYYGVKAIRFLIGENTSLKYGARLLDSIVGDNSTISCCEVLHSLVLPFHEQHHNNSFLIASHVQGQSNMAAGSTIGSNHNSRRNDGEMMAKRGFWPALSTSIPFNSKFASFTLLTKADYPNQLHLSLPFSLVTYNQPLRQLELIPAYWWMYNRYALLRNEDKFSSRDQRHIKLHSIETSFMAPDTIVETLGALELLTQWKQEKGLSEGLVTTTSIERSNMPTRILKTQEGIEAYKEMLLFGCMRIILSYLKEHHVQPSSLTELGSPFTKQELLQKQFINLGGQIINQHHILSLIEDIEHKRVNSWYDIHRYYDSLNDTYQKEQAHLAYSTLLVLANKEEMDQSTWKTLVKTFTQVCTQTAQMVTSSRERDLHDPFRTMIYHSKEQQEAILGDIKSKSFVLEASKKMENLSKRASDFALWI